MVERTKTYFVSDVHLGSAFCDSMRLEKDFVDFLDGISSDARALYLLGDIFDFWYEYRYVIPRGHTRTLGKLAELCDSGVEVCFFPGNHDVWAYGYFEKEIGMKILSQPYVMEAAGCRFCLGHGDGLGKTDAGFRFIRWMFHNRFLQRLFSAVHPRWAFALGYAWAAHSKKMKMAPDNAAFSFKGEDEPVFRFADDFGRNWAAVHGGGIDYYIFGHLHTPARTRIPSGGELIILGDWSHGGEYAVYDGCSLSLVRRYF